MLLFKHSEFSLCLNPVQNLVQVYNIGGKSANEKALIISLLLQQYKLIGIKAMRILLFILTISFYSTVWSYPYSNIYIFGDSLSDTGRLFEASEGQLPPEPYYQGRISNGPVWPEQLAPLLNLTYTPETNFAWAGATSGTTNTLDDRFNDLSGLQQQIDNYLVTTEQTDPDALYIIWIGSNDFLEISSIFQAQTVINEGVNHIVNAVEQLQQHGAQHILVPNIPDLAKTPRMSQSVMGSMLANLTLSFNNLLAENLQDSKVILVDIPESLAILQDETTLTNSTELSFTNFTESCVDIEAETVCNNPEQHFYWDDLHPSTQGHFVIALMFYAAVAEPRYADERLHLPIVKVKSGETSEFIFNTGLLRDLTDERFALHTTDHSISTYSEIPLLVATLGDIPTFDNSTGVLSLPVVYAGDQLSEKYQLELQLDLATIDNSSTLPKFLLNLDTIVPLNSD